MQMKIAKKYSVHEIIGALDLAIQGRSCDEIADELYLTTREVVAIVRSYTSGLIRARERRARPRDMPKVAERRERRNQLGRPSQLSLEQRARILQLHGEGLTYKEVAHAVGCTEYQARYIAESGA